MAQINKPTMKLEIVKRGHNDLKKVLIYGLDKSGKSTFAEKYCKENHLHPLVVDVDDTNYTDLDLVFPSTETPLDTHKSIINTINAVKDTDYDTIIVDGVSSLLEHLTGVGKGMSAYSERARLWGMILRKLKNSGKHLIFIGQIDLKISEDDTQQPSKAIIHINSMVNEKYYCYVNKKGKDKEYLVETEVKREKKE